jgi:hypothetical protein
MSLAVKMGARLIESRRRAENSYREMDAVRHNDQKSHLIATFEQKTTKRIETNAKQVRRPPF